MKSHITVWQLVSDLVSSGSLPWRSALLLHDSSLTPASLDLLHPVLTAGAATARYILPPHNNGYHSLLKN